MNRRNLIKIIGAAICAGMTPRFVMAAMPVEVLRGASARVFWRDDGFFPDDLAFFNNFTGAICGAIWMNPKAREAIITDNITIPDQWDDDLKDLIQRGFHREPCGWEETRGDRIDKLKAASRPGTSFWLPFTKDY